MSTAATELTRADPEQATAALEHVLATGDLASFSPQQRVAFYLKLCEAVGLSSFSRPFDWLVLDGKLTLYPNKSCAEQLRRQHQISVKVTRFEVVGSSGSDPMVVCAVEGSRPNGQTDFASKYVPLTGFNTRTQQSYRLSGKELGNAHAKAETGAKRRLTFSMVGLASIPDLDDIKAARYAVVDAYGNVVERPTEEQRSLAENPRQARVIGEPTFETTASPEDSPLAPGVSQAVTPEELERPKRTIPRQSFRPSAEELQRRQGAWFAAVKGTSLDSDGARHDFVAAWTLGEGWPKAKQTNSLRTALGRMTEREAEDFLGHVRAIAYDEKTAAEEALASHNAEQAAEEVDEETF